MRELTIADAHRAVLGGGVLACGGGGWRHHGLLMGRTATTIGRPVLASVEELPADSWVATVTAIGAPAAKNWEIRPVDYVHALETLQRHTDHRIAAVFTAQNGYSTTLNGWIQSAVLGVTVLDAAGDIRAHPTGKLGSLGLAQRVGYESVQVVCGGNRETAGHFTSVNIGRLDTCDDVLRDISVRAGGFIASARNPLELAWVREHGALGAIQLALDLGAAMEAAGAHVDAVDDPPPTLSSAEQDAVLDAVACHLGGRILERGPLQVATGLATHGGWDHGEFRIGDLVVSYLNEYMTVECVPGDGSLGTAATRERVASYPDTIVLVDVLSGEGLAVKDATVGRETALIVVPAAGLPVSSSAIDRSALAECERIMDRDFLPYLDEGLRGGTQAYVAA